MSDQLLTTKLHIPSSRPNLVARPHLAARLDDGLQQGRRLSLLCAPAGYGKTTLAVDWLNRSGRSAAWLSLEAQDNDPVRFWRYVIAALQTAHGGLGQAILPVLQSGAPMGAPTALQPLLIELLNDISAHAQALTLVLDDYHVIVGETIHTDMAFLLDHLPADMHVALLTRVDPPLPIARWRARNQLTEIRGADLRFAPEEAARFLTAAMGLALSDDETAALTARTEGWIAGLQLAAVALQSLAASDRAETRDFIARFTGTQQHILDYLVEDVLLAQPQDVQLFLMQTSILERMTGALCEVVTGQTQAADVLAYLDKANLFLIPLDGERRWYRYHHLFAELLRARLNAQHPGEVSALHLRAAQWLEQAGSMDEAIQHMCAAEEFEQAARLVERAWNPLIHSGQIVTLLRWLDALPAALVRATPMLSVAYGWGRVLSGRHAAAEPHLQDAEQALARLLAGGTLHPTDPACARVQAEVACLRSLIVRVRGDAPQAQALAEQAIALAPPDDTQLRGNAYLILGQAHFDLGQAERALAAYRAASPLALQSRSYVAASLAQVYTALLYQLQGCLHDAETTCREGLQQAAELGFEHLPAVSVIEATLAYVLYEWNDLDEAERYAARAFEAGRRSGYAEAFRVGGALLARVRLAQHRLADAVELLEAVSLNKASGASAANTLLADAQVRCLIQQGNVVQATRLADSLGQQTPNAIGFARTAIALIQARVKLASDLGGEALSLLAPCVPAPKANQQRDAAEYSALVEALALRALAHWKLGQPELARQDIQRALDLAAPEGYARVFLDEGEAMRLLMADCRGMIEKQARQGEAESTRALSYIDRLLLAYPTSAPQASHIESEISNQKSDILTDPLTERELQVLRLMAEGWPNAEIAARLVVAESTVKKHVNHIFDKLGAQTRVQALVKARELGWL